MAEDKDDSAKAAKKRPKAPVPNRESQEETVPDPEEKTPKKPDPTRFGDWEKNGRCIDF